MRLPGVVLMSVAAALLNACGVTPKETFYTLNPVVLPASADTAPGGARYTVAVGPVKVPEMVDRPQLVIRHSPNRVEVLEHHRWAQSLRAEIARVLAADLARRLRDAQVMPYTDYAGATADYRIVVDIEQFDAMPGQGVTVQAVWTVRRAAGLLQTGRSTVREPAHAAGYEELASAFGRALAAMSADLGNALQSAKQTPP